VSLQKHLVGRNGFIYVIQKFLKSRKDSPNTVSFARYQTDPQSSRAQSADQNQSQQLQLRTETCLFRSIEQARRIRNELSDSRFIRLHVDENEAESTLIFPYFTEDLLSLLRHTALPIDKTKRILRDILRGIEELHDKDWVHTGKLQSHSIH